MRCERGGLTIAARADGATSHVPRLDDASPFATSPQTSESAIQRHPALVPLSREHHFALKLARALRADGSRHLRATLPPEPAALAEHVRAVFAAELERHFVVEEQLVLGALEGRSAELDAICAEIRREHEQLRELQGRLGDRGLSDEGILAVLDRFGALLEEHVRSEERVLYDRVERTLDAASLAQLGERLLRPPG